MKPVLNHQSLFQYLLSGSLVGSILLLISFTIGCNPTDPSTQMASDTAAVIGEYPAELTHAPFVPAGRESNENEKVIVHIEVVEKVMKLADGVNYTFWTFGGTVPGPMIRVQEGDLVEMHLSNNPGNKMPHNIDLHAVNGPGGGAEATLTVPGHTSVFSFRAIGSNALQAKVGDRVRIYVGNGGPNLVSSFHVIGQIFDKVYQEGGSQAHQNIQTTLIPSGGAAIVEFVCREPGTFSIVDHSIFRAFNQGALAQLVVTGPADKNIYSGKIRDELYQPGNPDASEDPGSNGSEAETPELSFADRIKNGNALFQMNCSSCHQPTGLGMPGAFPPLAKSDFLMGRSDMGIGILLHGINNEPITGNGKHFQGVMPQLSLTDDQIASILTYVRNSWGNKSPIVKEKDVKKVRNQ